MTHQTFFQSKPDLETYMQPHLSHSFAVQPGVIVQQGGSPIVQQAGGASPIVQRPGSPVVQQTVSSPGALVQQSTPTIVQSHPTYPQAPPAPAHPPGQTPWNLFGLSLVTAAYRGQESCLLKGPLESISPFKAVAQYLQTQLLF